MNASTGGRAGMYTLRRRAMPYFFIAPFFVIYAIFGLYPFLSGISMSLQSKGEFAGFANYTALLTDQRFWKSILNASLYTLGSVFVILPVALVAALMLNSKIIGKRSGFVSTIFFIPSVTSVIVSGIIFKLLLKTNDGPINTLLKSLGLISENIKFLSDPNWAVPSLVIIGIWRYFGVNSLYFLSGLQGIPRELGEAARIDGASGWKEFWFVTLPLLKPISVYIIFTAITGSFSLFGEIYTLIPMDSAGTRDSMLFPVVYLYRSMFRDNRLNYAATMGYVIAVILFIITFLQRRIMRDND